MVKFVSFVIKNKDPKEELIEWFIKDKDEGILDPRPSSNSTNINIINEENAIIDPNQSVSNDDILIKEDKLIKNEVIRKDSGSYLSDKENEDNKNQKLIIKDENLDDKNDKEEKKKEEKKNTEKDENKIIINNLNEEENDKMIN